MFGVFFFLTIQILDDTRSESEAWRVEVERGRMRSARDASMSFGIVV